MKKVIVIMSVFAMAVPVMAFHARESANASYECDSCHIPHNAEELDGMPLWSGFGISEGGFTVYSSPTLNADNIGQPAGPTLLCLGCHDAGAEDGTHYQINHGAGKDLSGTHPMEFAYTATLASEDGELVNPDSTGSSTKVGGKGTITEDMLAADTSILNCQSCHDIHIQGLSDQSTDWSGDVPVQATGDAGDGEVAIDGNLWVDVDGDGVADLEDGATIPVMTTEAQTGTHSWKIPYLVNIPGIRYKTGWGGKAYEKDDYELVYGELCKTCHIK